MNKHHVLRDRRILVVGDHMDSLADLRSVLPLCCADVALGTKEADDLLDKSHYDAIILDFQEPLDPHPLDRAKDTQIPVIMLVGKAFSKDVLQKTFQKRHWYYASRNKLDKLDDLLVDIFQEAEGKHHYLNWYKRLSRLQNCYEIQLINENPEFWGSLFKY